MVVDALKQGQESITAVLCSAGLDSAVLVAHEARLGVVQPVFVTAGLAWEAAERKILTRLLAALNFPKGVRPLVLLNSPVGDVYPASHWALRGIPPTYNTPDRDVYLIGRNVLLLSKVAVFCAINGIQRIAIGPLTGNPFPDATPKFFTAMEQALEVGLDHKVRIVTPFADLRKKDVIKLGASLGVPLELTLSCMNQNDGRHCGRCSKCRERLQAFDAVGIEDPASYTFRPTDVSTGT